MPINPFRRFSDGRAIVAAVSTPVVAAVQTFGPTSSSSPTPASAKRVSTYDSLDAEVLSVLETEADVAFVVDHIAGGVARAKLVAVDLDQRGDVVGPTKNANVAAILQEITGGPAREAQLLRTVGKLMFALGQGWLVAEISTDVDGEDLWVWSAHSGKSLTPNGTNGTSWTLVDTDGSRRTVTTGENGTAVVIRLFDPSLADPSCSTSSVKRSLSIIRWRQALARYSISGLESQITRGILLKPSEMALPDADAADSGFDKLTLDLAEAMSAAIEDPASAPSRIPTIVTGPAEALAAMRILQWSSEIDGNFVAMWELLNKALATGLSVPADVLDASAGGNHWSDFLTAAETRQIAIQPILALLCDALTVGWFRAALEASGENPNLYSIWYDDSALIIPASKAANAIQAHSSGAISDFGLRQALDLPEEWAVTPDRPNSAPGVAVPSPAGELPPNGGAVPGEPGATGA